MSDGFTMDDFVRESNRIEGIVRDPTSSEVRVHHNFMDLDKPDVRDVATLVSVLQPGAVLRSGRGMNVRVGNHFPPLGGEYVQARLKYVLGLAYSERYEEAFAYRVHHYYETLHPFMDGNGRSGRALWLWMMGGIERAPLGFLHHWYYQSLQYGSLER